MTALHRLWPFFPSHSRSWSDPSTIQTQGLRNGGHPSRDVLLLSFPSRPASCRVRGGSEPQVENSPPEPRRIERVVPASPASPPFCSAPLPFRVVSMSPVAAKAKLAVPEILATVTASGEVTPIEPAAAAASATARKTPPRAKAAAKPGAKTAPKTAPKAAPKAAPKTAAKTAPKTAAKTAAKPTAAQPAVVVLEEGLNGVDDQPESGADAPKEAKSAKALAGIKVGPKGSTPRIRFASISRRLAVSVCSGPMRRSSWPARSQTCSNWRRRRPNLRPTRAISPTARNGRASSTCR